MLFLFFETSAGRYALDSQNIVEIIPLVRIKKMPAVPLFVAGIINFRGEPVPVIDLCALASGVPCKPLYSTRIILVHYPLADQVKIVGLIAERATDVAKGSKTGRAAGILIRDDATRLRADKTDNEEMVQWFDIPRMIPEDIVRSLFPD